VRVSGHLNRSLFRCIDFTCFDDNDSRHVIDVVHKVVAVGSRDPRKAQEFIDTVAGGDKDIKAGTYGDVYTNEAGSSSSCFRLILISFVVFNQQVDVVYIGQCPSRDAPGSIYAKIHSHIEARHILTTTLMRSTPSRLENMYFAKNL